jgi:hypothetical protein
VRVVELKKMAAEIGVAGHTYRIVVDLVSAAVLKVATLCVLIKTTSV